MIKVSPYIGITMLLFGLNYKVKGQKDRICNESQFFCSSCNTVIKKEYSKPLNSIKHSAFQQKQGEQNELHAFVALSGIATSNNNVPFWMRSMQYGSIPLSGVSTSLEAGVTKEYSPSKKDQLFDWGAGAEARFNVGYTTQAILVEAYAKARLGAFQLKAGRSKDMMGLVDSTLSTGAFAISGNALGIPKVELSIPEYTSLGFTKDLIAIKGNFAHGWVGEQRLNDSVSQISYANTYFHQKSLYARLAKPDWKLKFYGGFNHQAMWGQEDEIFQYHNLSTLETYKYVFTGTAYGGGNGIPRSKVGNHVGSIDQTIEYHSNKHVFTVYHQFFYEAGALAALANLKDGVWGLSIKNKKASNSSFSFQKIMFEVVTSKSQGGEVDSKPRNSGAEDYYNNFLYTKGWTYQNENIGNVLFTSKKYINKGLPQKENQYFVNNRITAFHTGVEFSYKNWDFKSLITWAKNFGTYATYPETRGRGEVTYYNKPPYFGEVGQFSAIIEASKHYFNNYKLVFLVYIDRGELLNNTTGVHIKLCKYL